MNQTGIYIFGQPASTGRIGEGLDRGVVQSESNGAGLGGACWDPGEVHGDLHGLG